MQWVQVPCNLVYFCRTFKAFLLVPKSESTSEPQLILLTLKRAALRALSHWRALKVPGHLQSSSEVQGFMAVSESIRNANLSGSFCIWRNILTGTRLWTSDLEIGQSLFTETCKFETDLLPLRLRAPASLSLRLSVNIYHHHDRILTSRLGLPFPAGMGGPARQGPKFERHECHRLPTSRSAATGTSRPAACQPEIGCRVAG